MTRRSLLFSAPIAGQLAAQPKSQPKTKSAVEGPAELLITLPGPQTIKLSQFRGKVLLVNFLLTT